MKIFIAQIIIVMSLVAVPAQASTSQVPRDRDLNAFPDGCFIQPLPQPAP
jgi:hypothetical protein